MNFSRFALFLAIFIAPLLSMASENPKVEIKTDLGSFIIELYPNEAPITVQNFLSYVDSKFYDGTIFHRVVPGFIVQGGGVTVDFSEKETRAAIKNESDNGLRNDYQTVAMARLSNPDSATSQFYVNLKGNSNLNATTLTPGYTVFGKVIKGMEVIEKISVQPRGFFKRHLEAPSNPVYILSAKRFEGSINATNPMLNNRIKDALVKPQ